MMWTVWANSGESLETIEKWHPDKLFRAYQALNLLSDRVKENMEGGD